MPSKRCTLHAHRKIRHSTEHDELSEIPFVVRTRGAQGVYGLKQGLYIRLGSP